MRARSCSQWNDWSTTSVYTLSLHDALPIFLEVLQGERRHLHVLHPEPPHGDVARHGDHDLSEEHAAAAQSLQREEWTSTRVNSSHITISYAVFCMKKKKNQREGSEIGVRQP